MSEIQATLCLWYVILTKHAVKTEKKNEKEDIATTATTRIVYALGFFFLTYGVNGVAAHFSSNLAPKNGAGCEV